MPVGIDIEPVLAKLRRKRVTVAAIYAAASEIEAAMARAGYVLSRVTVPPQKLVNGGTLHLYVVDGFIEAIDDSRVPEHVRSAIAERVAELVGVHGLTMPEIERRLLLAGELGGVQLRSALIRGQQVGGAKLLLAADWHPISMSLGADNLVGSSYRAVEFPLTVSLNSPFGLGESIYGSAISGPDTQKLFADSPVRRIASLGAILPLGSNGLTFNPEFSRTDTNPIVAATATRTQGLFDRLALKLAYPLIKTRAASLNVTGSFEVLDETQTAILFHTLLNQDRLRIFTLGLNGASPFVTGGTLSGGAVVTQGIDALGARDQAIAKATGIPLTRQGARPDFTKADGHLRLDQPFAENMSAALMVRGQASLSGALPISAQFSIDGADAVSSLDMGSLSTDSGIVTRGEIARAFQVSAGGSNAVLAPYVFSAAGIGSLASPTALEQRTVTANAYGIGLRGTFPNPGTGTTSVILIELGQVHGNTTPTNTRLTVSWAVRY